MLWTRLTLTDADDVNSVNLPLVGAQPSDPFILKSVDSGLGPPEIDVAISNTPEQGGVLGGVLPQLKQLVLKIGLNPDYSVGQTVSDLRAYFYGMLTGGYTGNLVYLLVKNGGVEMCRTTGYISKIEPVFFSKDPEIQVTINCLSPYFQARDFVYPDVLTLSKTEPVITNLGTAPTGFQMDLTFTSPLDHWRLSKPVGTSMMQLDFDFLVGDELIFNTVPGNRFIIVRRGVDQINILHTLTWFSDWFQLYRGDNAYETSSDDFDWGPVYYKPQYWGL